MLVFILASQILLFPTKSFFGKEKEKVNRINERKNSKEGNPNIVSADT